VVHAAVVICAAIFALGFARLRYCAGLIVGSNDGHQFSLRLNPGLCLCADPAPPTVQSRSHNTIFASWPFVSFCGIAPPAYVDSVQYILEIAQGVEYKPGYLSRFISDVCAVDYRTVCAGPNIGSTTIQGLLPSRWYHLRLSIEYLGQRFVSESTAIHTPTWVPSAPGMPRVNVLPVLSSFDLQSDVPVRMDMIICWNPSSANGLNITRYQCHIQKFNALGYVIQSSEAVHRREKQHRNRTYYQSPERDPRANQWTQSPGRSMMQIHNSIVHGDRSPPRGRTAHAQSSRAASHSPDRLPELSDAFAQSGSLVTSPEERRFKWEIAFDNILTSFKCPSPSADQAEWHIRVRARNANGWSDFSPVLKMNGLTHPSLFASPPPANCYGTCYYTEHASSQYLDGNAAEQFRSSDRSIQHGAATAPLLDDINVRNELFLHARAPPKSKKASPKSKSNRSPKSPKSPKTPNSLRREESEIRAKQLAESMMTTATNSAKSNLGSNSESIKAGPPKLHVLHFKQGNTWEHPSLEPSMEFSSSLPTHGSTKKSESLPSLGAHARAGSNRALFSKN
jgi:hypothetical protein